MTDQAEILVDARGHRCPVPTLRLRRALEVATPGSRLLLMADDPLARIDVPHLTAALDAQILNVSEADGTLSFVIMKKA